MKTTPAFLWLTILVCWCIGCGEDRIEPGFTGGSGPAKGFVPERVVRVEKQDIPRMYEAVGTIRPLTESVIESQVSGQVEKVLCVPGQAVRKGQLLIELDDRRLQAQLKQAREGLSVARNQLAQIYKSRDEARAGLDQTEAAFNRSRKLFESGIVPSQTLEVDQSAFLQAKARLEKAQEAESAGMAAIRGAEEIVREAEIALGYARILSPADGVVIRKMTDPGDVAMPGKPLIILQTSGALRLEAQVREGLISRVTLGSPYEVHIETLEKTVTAVVEEIVPYADPDTRTFLVKASLPDTPGIYPGMFGRLRVPVALEPTLLIPKDAVVRVGQLELCYVETDGVWRSVFIKTGRSLNERVEVLSGLSGNDTIGY